MFVNLKLLNLLLIIHNFITFNLEKIIKILDYQVPDSGEYLVLEGKSRGNKNSKIIHVLHLGKHNNIKIGRGNGGKQSSSLKTLLV